MLRAGPEPAPRPAPAGRRRVSEGLVMTTVDLDLYIYFNSSKSLLTFLNKIIFKNRSSPLDVLLQCFEEYL